MNRLETTLEANDIGIHEFSDLVKISPMSLKEIANRAESDQIIVNLLIVIARLYAQMRDIKDSFVGESEMAMSRKEHGDD